MLLSVTSTTQITHSNFLDESRHNLCLLTNHFFDNVKPCPISTHRFEYRRVTTCVISLITYMFHKNPLWLAGTLLEVCNFQGSGNQIVISDSRIFIHAFPYAPLLLSSRPFSLSYSFFFVTIKPYTDSQVAPYVGRSINIDLLPHIVSLSSFCLK